MLRLRWFTTAVATAGLLAAGSLARADDTVPLGLKKTDVPTFSLAGTDDDRDADVLEVGRGGGHGGGGHGGGGFHGGYRGGYGRGGFGYGRGGYGYGRGWYGGYGRGWYGGYGRGWYGGYGRGWYGYPYYGGWWGLPYYSGLWGAGYYPYGYGYYPSVYYGAPAVYPNTTVVVPSVSLSTSPALQAQPGLAPASIETAPPPAVVPADGTFPYDGGPRNPPPMPRADPAPSAAPVSVPLSGGVVAAPAKTGYRYLAYGEKLKPAPLTRDRSDTYVLKANTTGR